MLINPIIIHYHIFKNAGSSIDFALQSAFGDSWTSFEGEQTQAILSQEALRTFLDAHPKIRAVSSHLARPPLPYEDSLPIVFLRHPILRAKSVYEFVKKDDTQYNHKIASEGSLRKYVEMALSGGSGGLVIKNYQVIHLSDASFRQASILNAIAQPADLKQAEKLLFSWPIFGIVESYEKSLELYQTLYSRRIWGLKLPFTWFNKTTQINSKTSIDAQLEAIRDELGNKTFDALNQANDLDLRLYSSCVKRFEENVSRYLR